MRDLVCTSAVNVLQKIACKTMKVLPSNASSWNFKAIIGALAGLDNKAITGFLLPFDWNVCFVFRENRKEQVEEHSLFLWWGKK